MVVAVGGGESCGGAESGQARAVAEREPCRLKATPQPHAAMQEAFGKSSTHVEHVVQLVADFILQFLVPHHNPPTTTAHRPTSTLRWPAHGSENLACSKSSFSLVEPSWSTWGERAPLSDHQGSACHVAGLSACERVQSKQYGRAGGRVYGEHLEQRCLVVVVKGDESLLDD